MPVGDTRAGMIEQLRRYGIRDERVLAAMGRVPREEFVREADREIAYTDHALPIGEGQTISQPYVVARMTELLAPAPEDRVLEIGTGSGYQAAVLAELAGSVITVERHAPLATHAAAVIDRLGYRNVRVHHGDASAGWTEDAPYDGILMTAAAPGVDPALLAQLTRSGRLVAPIGDEEMQELTVFDAAGRRHEHGAVRFVPLRGRAGFRT